MNPDPTRKAAKGLKDFEEVLVGNAVHALLRSRFARKEPCELSVKGDEVLCVFSSLQLVLNMAIRMLSATKIDPHTVCSSEMFAQPLRTCVSFHAGKKFEVFSAMGVDECCLPKLCVSFMLAFIPCPVLHYSQVI